MYLTIGTAQFGLKYGLEKKKIKSNEIKLINQILKRNNIIYFDTAINYGNSEKRIGELILKKKKIITKISLPEKKKINLKKWFFNVLNNSMKRLGVSKLYGILIHNTSDIFKNSEFLDLILQAKYKKLVSKVGVSIYEKKELNKILKIWTPDIIQFPVNIFDQRFINKKFLQKIKKLGIETYARSCFLQGVLLKKKLHNGNYKNQVIFNKFLKWCEQNNINQLQSCLHFVKQIKNIDSLVIGFDDSKQLKQILRAFNKRTIVVPYKFINNEKKLIDPRKWRVN